MGLIQQPVPLRRGNPDQGAGLWVRVSDRGKAKAQEMGRKRRGLWVEVVPLLLGYASQGGGTGDWFQGQISPLYSLFL